MLHRTLLLAQRAADEAVAEAQFKARQILDDAESKSRGPARRGRVDGPPPGRHRAPPARERGARARLAPRGAARRRRRARALRVRVPRPPAPRARGRPRVARGSGPGRAVGAPADPRGRPARAERDARRRQRDVAAARRRRHAVRAAAVRRTADAAAAVDRRRSADRGDPRARHVGPPEPRDARRTVAAVAPRRRRRRRTVAGTATPRASTARRPAADAPRTPLFPPRAGRRGAARRRAFFASLREAVSDQSPLGPRDERPDSTGAYEDDDDERSGLFRRRR